MIYVFVITSHVYCDITSHVQGFQYFFKTTSTSLFTGNTFLLNFEQFSWISYATLFKIRRYQRPFRQVKVPGTAPYWKACMFIVILLHMFIVILLHMFIVILLHMFIVSWWLLCIWIQNGHTNVSIKIRMTKKKAKK